MCLLIYLWPNKVKYKYKKCLYLKHCELFDNLIYIMHFSYSQKHEKFNVAVEKEDKKRKVFLYFYTN